MTMTRIASFCSVVVVVVVAVVVAVVAVGIVLVVFENEVPTGWGVVSSFEKRRTMTTPPEPIWPT